jgi:ubiquitin C-terminal hydrolase
MDLFCQDDNIEHIDDDILEDENIDVEIDDDDTNGTSGLVNLGNSCYMNSIIQCLSNCDDFRSFIIGSELIPKLIKYEKNYNLGEKNIDNNLSFQLRKILINIWNSSFYSFRPISFKTLFGKKIELFQNTNQQDSQEALLCIIDSIHEEIAIEAKIIPNLKNINYDLLDELHKDEDANIQQILHIIKRNKLDYLMYKSVKDFISSHKKYSLINNLFEGRVINQLTCSETSGIKVNFESFFYFSLAIPNDSNELDEISSDDDSSSDDESSDNDEELEGQSEITENSEDETSKKDEDEKSDEDNDKDSISSEKTSVSSSSSDSESDSDSDKIYNIENIKDVLNKNTKKNNKKYTLYDLMENFIKPEDLTGENKWRSPYVNKLVDTQKINLLWETPKILIILLKRFEYTFTGATKLNNIIEFPIDELDVSPYLHSNNISKYKKYTLFAINNHTNFSNFGFNGISFGHYYSYCKNYTNNKWYNFDDDNVTEINESDLITKEAYMLFYKAIE